MTETVPIATIHLIDGVKGEGVFRVKGQADVRQSNIIKVAGGLSLLMTASGPARTQSIRGELGYQSRASIRIDASVMPKFQLSGPSDTPSVSSNAPALRYSLSLDDSPAPSHANAEAVASRPDEPRLMLVVPD